VEAFVKAISPETGGREIVLAKDQPQYLPLPAAVHDDGHRLVTRWAFTDEERAKIAAGADLYLHTYTFGHPFQPVRLHVGREELNG